MSLYQQLANTPEEQLIEVIQKNTSWTSICRHFGSKRGNDPRMIQFLRKFVQDKNISTEHFSHKTGVQYDRCKYTEQDLCWAIQSHTSWIAVMESLQLCPNGNTQKGLEKKAQKAGQPTEHLTGVPRHFFQKNNPRRWTQQNGFKTDSPISKNSLRRLAKKCLTYICQKCGNPGIWNGVPLILDLDHINGKRTDHRKENLRFLCPNCHSQTPTHRGHNKPMRA